MRVRKSGIQMILTDQLVIINARLSFAGVRLPGCYDLFPMRRTHVLHAAPLLRHSLHSDHVFTQ